MNETIAVGSRHVVIDLRDYVASTLGGGQRGVHANAETAKTVRIRWGDFNQGHVNGHGAALEEFFDFAEINRRVIRTAVVDSLTHVGADKNRVVTEVPGHLRRYIRGHSHGHHVDDFHVAYCGTPT